MYSEGHIYPLSQKQSQSQVMPMLFAAIGALAMGFALGQSFANGGASFGLTNLVQISSSTVRVQPGNALVGRREAMAGMMMTSAAAVAAFPGRAEAAYGSSSASGAAAVAEPVDFQQFYGAANPPATYGGVGGTTRDLARYGYLVNMATWKEVAVGKVEKGIGGIDSQWEGPGKKRAFAVTVTRAGEDNVGYTSGGKPEEVIRSLAGAEPNLQDALQNGEVTYSRAEKNGVQFLDFDVTGDKNHYLVRVGVKSGRLFAFFVTAPTKTYQKDQEVLKRTLESFEVY